MIKIIKGDLLKATEDYIAHQCNCLTKNSAGLAFKLFKKFPYANVYKTRMGASIPGTIQVCGNGQEDRYVVNMFSQYAPGKAWDTAENDTYVLRVQYFTQCLSAIGQIKDIKSVAFPMNIGCGIAGGKWQDYFKMLNDFAESHPHIEVVIYDIGDE